jgi:tetratricopeptide (TPR) repeat protein
MNLVQTIKKLLSEAELYQTQGLLSEAKTSYLKAAALIKTSEQLKNSQNLLDGITRKIKALSKDVNRFDNSPITPEVPDEKQDMIKNLFAFPSDPGDGKTASTDLEGSIILAKFGQYERAMKEFESLLQNESVRVVAAKNLLRCHVAVASIDDALQQYKRWAKGDLFTREQLEKVTFFMKGLAKNTGVPSSR